MCVFLKKSLFFYGNIIFSKTYNCRFHLFFSVLHQRQFYYQPASFARLAFYGDGAKYSANDKERWQGQASSAMEVWVVCFIFVTCTLKSLRTQLSFEMMRVHFFLAILLLAVSSCQWNDQTSESSATNHSETAEPPADTASATAGKGKLNEMQNFQQQPFDEALVENFILEIKKMQQAIDEVAYNCEVQKFNGGCENQPVSGELNYYLSGDTIVKIEHFFVEGNYSGGMRKYYFYENRLFLAFYENSHWLPGMDTTYNADGSAQIPAQKFVNQRRYFFYQQQLIRCLEKEVNAPDTEIEAALNKQNFIEIECEPESVAANAGALQKLYATQQFDAFFCPPQ